MLKVAVVIVLLLGAAFGTPAIRNRITPVLAPVLDKLGPVGRKLGDPAKKLAARNEASFLLRKLAEEYQQNRELPTPLRFQVWVRLNTRGGKGGMDPWGRPYYMIHANRQLAVGSPGPDRRRSTRDDIRVSVPFN